jgi:hypothetical protein
MQESAAPIALDRIEDARIAAARSLLPLARDIFKEAKRQADAIDRTERRFGAPTIMQLARLLDDLWMAADNLICDLDDAS